MKSLQVFAALAHRNFRLFWFGQLISLTGTQNALLTAALFCTGGSILIIFRKPELLKL